MCEGGREIIKLDICKKHPMEKDEKFRSMGIGTFGL
jgi:hypothetical protein